jgi:hypothetical protein
MKLAPSSEKDFESEVRNIARQLWPDSGYNGAITLEGKERDSIFVTDEVVHYLEITTSKSEKNTTDNIKKIEKLIPILQAKYAGRIIKGWYITRHELTGEQGRHFQPPPPFIFHATYHQFLSKLIDSRNYLNLREQMAFGSARSVEDNSISFPDGEFVPSELRDYDTGKTVSYHSFRRSFIKQQQKHLITGEFGVGKSMLARQLFLELAKAHRDGQDFCFPVYINLRDHIDAQFPYLCLMKHATSVGFPRPEELVRAWRAGYVYLILDGFDELTPTISTKDVRRAKDLRRSALELVRRFIDESGHNTSMLVTGRSNFFDSTEDLVDCLGIKNGWNKLFISDFNEEQAKIYLRKKGYANSLPGWLPRRPLLIGYLAARQLIPEHNQTSEGHDNDHVIGWRYLLEAIAKREVDQVYIALDPK